jgi:hypothetical protein
MWREAAGRSTGRPAALCSDANEERQRGARDARANTGAGQSGIGVPSVGRLHLGVQSICDQRLVEPAERAEQGLRLGDPRGPSRVVVRTLWRMARSANVPVLARGGDALTVPPPSGSEIALRRDDSPVRRSVSGCRRCLYPPRAKGSQRVITEREGFEPSMDGTAHTGFRDRRRGPESPVK